MNPDVWKLHASVFELARARGVGAFRVDYKAHPGGVVIELVLGPGDARPEPVAEQPLPAPAAKPPLR